jgi:hypothetical protein
METGGSIGPGAAAGKSESDLPAEPGYSSL